MFGRVLIIAGSDSGGGAGIQADIKTVTALKGYAATALTALTAQDTRQVHRIIPVEPEFIRQQIQVVREDIGVDAFKIGMLSTAAVIEVVGDELSKSRAPIILDPVITAKGGSVLLETSALESLKTILLPMASLLTPNLWEAQLLTETSIDSVQKMKDAAKRLLDQGVPAVLIKGGHLPGSTVSDVLMTEKEEYLFESERIQTPHTHGTGCTLASAIATRIAQGVSLSEAVANARSYVSQAIRTAPGYGKGHGPLNHAHTVP